MSDLVQRQLEIIRNGLIDLISEEELKLRIQTSIDKKKPLRIKYGADPSAPDLHLGHTVPLRKLRQFQDLGHQVVFIIGDFTAQIGDPTQRSETRKRLTPEEVMQNAKTYQDQVFKILDRKQTEVRYNSEWLGKMSPVEFLNLTAQYTVARLLERDDFQKRFQSNRPISLIEFMYPLLQGYDSVMIRSDIELGGTDQKFNLLVGRELQKIWGQTPQMVMTLPLIEGTDGVQKMSKSFGNHIGILESPREIFGKVMSIPDGLLERYYLYASGLPLNEATQVVSNLKSGSLHPREAKAELGRLIVSLYHSREEGDSALREFDQIFKSKGMPDAIPEIKISSQSLDVVTLLKEARLVDSKGEGRRLIQQGGVKINQVKVEDPAMLVHLDSEVLIQCGKRKFAKVMHAG